MIGLIKATFYIIITLSIFNASKGQSIIIGSIKDSLTNTPIESVNIRIKNSFVGTTSDRKGLFELKLNPGKHKIVITHVSYKRLEKDIKIIKNDTIFTSFKLKRKVKQLGSIAIYGLKETILSQYYIRPSSIRNRPALAESDLLRTIAFLPGIIQTNDYRASLNVRGGFNDQNQILLDGTEIFHPQHLKGIFSAFNLLAIEDIDVYTGNFPAKHTGRLSSIIDIKTLSHINNKKVIANLSLLSASISSNFKIGDTFFLLAGRRTYLDLIGSMLGHNFPYNFYDSNLKIQHKLSDNINIEFHGFLNVDSWSEKTNYADWGNYMGMVRLNYKYNNFKNSLAYSISQYFLTSGDENNNFSISNIFREYSFRYNGSYISNKFYINYGFNYKNYLLNYFWNTHNPDLSLYLFPLMPRNFKEKEKYNIFNIYFSPSLFILDNFVVNGFLRFFIYKKNKKVISSGMSTSFILSDNSKISLSAQKNFQFYTSGIQPKEFEINPPMFFLDIPQKASFYSLGFDVTGFKQYRFKSELYYKNFCNIVKLSNNLIDFPLFEYGNGFVWGLDLIFEKFTGRITFQLIYSYTNINLNFNKKWIKPSWDIPHSFKLLSGFKLSKTWEVNIGLIYRSGNPYKEVLGVFWGPWNATNTGNINIIDYNRLKKYGILSENNYLRFPSYFRLDISLRKKYHNKYFDWILYLQIQNITYNKNKLRKDWEYNLSTNKLNDFVEALPIIPSIGAQLEL